MILERRRIKRKVPIYQSPEKWSSATMTNENMTMRMKSILERVLISISTSPVLDLADFEFISALVCLPV